MSASTGRVPRTTSGTNILQPFNWQEEWQWMCLQRRQQCQAWWYGVYSAYRDWNSRNALNRPYPTPINVCFNERVSDCGSVMEATKTRQSMAQMTFLNYLCSHGHPCSGVRCACDGLKNMALLIPDLSCDLQVNKREVFLRQEQK